LIEYAAENCFSKHDVTEDINCLANRNIPLASRNFVQVNDAKHSFGRQDHERQEGKAIDKDEVEVDADDD
jgi:hypothetical protein